MGLPVHTKKTPLKIGPDASRTPRQPSGRQLAQSFAMPLVRFKNPANININNNNGPALGGRFVNLALINHASFDRPSRRDTYSEQQSLKTPPNTPVPEPAT